MTKKNQIMPVILAGGLGTRLRSVLGDFPKVLAPINKRPFLTYLLDQLVCAGFNEVFLCVGYKSNLVSETIGTRYKSLSVNYSVEKAPLGTGGALANLIPILPEKNRSLMVLNGDSYIDLDLTDLVSWHGKNQLTSSIVSTRVDDVSRYGNIVFDEQNRVIEFEEKDETATRPGWINAGIYIFPKSLLTQMPEQPFSLEQEFLPILMENRLQGFKCNGRFIDIGTPQSYGVTEKFFDSITHESNHK